MHHSCLSASHHPGKTPGPRQRLSECLSNININPSKQILVNLSLVRSGCCGKSLLLCDPERLCWQAGGQGAFPASLAGSLEDRKAKVGAPQWHTCHQDSFLLPQVPPESKAQAHHPSCPLPTQMKNQILQTSKQTAIACAEERKRNRGNPNIRSDTISIIRRENEAGLWTAASQTACQLAAGLCHLPRVFMAGNG